MATKKAEISSALNSYVLMISATFRTNNLVSPGLFSGISSNASRNDLICFFVLVISTSLLKDALSSIELFSVARNIISACTHESTLGSLIELIGSADDKSP